MEKNEDTEARATMEAVLSDGLDAARRRLEELKKELVDREAAIKPLRAAVAAAKLEVERTERASKAYGANRIKRGARKPKALPPATGSSGAVA